MCCSDLYEASQIKYTGHHHTNSNWAGKLQSVPLLMTIMDSFKCTVSYTTDTVEDRQTVIWVDGHKWTQSIREPVTQMVEINIGGQPDGKQNW